MGVFMKKLLGLTIIFSIISVFGISAMEEFYAGPEGAAPEYLVREMEQEREARKLREYEQMKRQQKEAERQQFFEDFRQEREQRPQQENMPNYQPTRRRLEFGQ